MTRHSLALSALLWVAMGLVQAPAYAGDCTITPAPSWKNTIDFPDDPFRHSAGVEPGWIKFVILTCDPPTVYFQDSTTYLFHSEFAINELDPFIGLTPAQFDAVSLFESGQQAILGTVIMPTLSDLPPQDIPEYGISFVRQDPYTPQEIVDLFNTVKGAINASPGVQAFYFPTFEQASTAEANADFLEQNGLIISSPARWADGNVCYSEGWALGPLKFFPGDQIDSAYLSGALTPNDILLTDGVPAEIPFVAGVLSLTPSTPNSHVAILAKTFNVPFAYLLQQDDVDRANALLGQRVVLRAYGESDNCAMRMIEIDGVLTEEQIGEILQLKVPPVLNITPMATLGNWSASTEGLLPADIQFFGGKAANFGVLRRSIPDNSPKALALSFDVWNAFLDQMLGGGETLREHITQLVGGYTYPPDFAALEVDLTAIRDLFKNDLETTFSPTLESAIIAALQDPQFGFDPMQRLRFRSSTNVEDSDQFTGAGLYDSRSGCLQDDLDGDDFGPSWCEVDEPDERGVFRAIRRVFASFYNTNAFLERLRHNVDESTVGMAILVHHSFPDDIELANGVATFDEQSQFFTNVDLVTQDGAVSVTNPENGAIPEEVRVNIDLNGTTYPFFVSPSNLIPLGDRVLEWPDEYDALSLLLDAAAEEYGDSSGLGNYLLDFEYKKMAPGGAAVPAGGLVIKQVRRIPVPDDTPSITPFLVNEPTEYVTFQGEYWYGGDAANDVFSVHRLKSLWSIQTESMWMTPQALSMTFYTTAAHDWLDGCSVQTQPGTFSDFPDAGYTYEFDSRSLHTWTQADVPIERSYTVRVDNVVPLVSPAEPPILTPRDLGTVGGWLDLDDPTGCIDLRVDYAEPMLSTVVGDGTPTTTLSDAVGLCPRATIQPDFLLEQRSFSESPLPITIDTSFYWPRAPHSFVAGFTSPAVEFVETTITGLTTDPIVLTGYYAQSYRPGHHNFTEQFAFEPRLEPGISPQILSELEAQDVRVIHVFGDRTFPEFTTITTFSDVDLGGPCGCASHAQCADGDGDGVRDDACLWWACAAGQCEGTAIAFADMGGSNGACPPDGAADGNDRFHALNCFSNITTLGTGGYPCEGSPPTAFNVDAGGPFGSCLPDGVCDGNDAFHALNAFSGVNTCSCPAPAPSQPATKRPRPRRTP